MANPLYTVEPIYKEVSKEEFVAFINNYPRALIRDVCGICDPPAVSYNDFELANKFPYSIVARTSLYSDNPNDYLYETEDSRVYEILINYQECFDSKTGYKE